jgi:hemerythrin-like metal-binding protein
MTEPVYIDQLEDLRIAPFRDLPDRALRREGRYFIAEGEFVVERMFQCGYRAEAVLVVESRLERVGPMIPEGVTVYVAPRKLVSRSIGFKFHLGVIALGLRQGPADLDAQAGRWGRDVCLLILPRIINTENLGGLLRIAAAVGVSGVLLGPRCGDPYYRQCVRVSMGGVFQVPLMRSDNLQADISRLRDREGLQMIATVVEGPAEPLVDQKRPARMGLLLGSESTPLGPSELALCDRRVTIPMRLGADSLNVAVAAGCRYGLTAGRRCPIQESGRQRMAFIDWDKADELGLDEIDRQHRNMVEIINDLWAAWRQKQPCNHLLELLSQLVRYSEEHFLYEQQEMEAAGYEGLDEHRFQHDVLLGEIRRMRRRSSGCESLIDAGFFEYLRRWFTDHTRGLDQNMAEHQRCRAAG